MKGRQIMAQVNYMPAMAPAFACMRALANGHEVTVGESQSRLTHTRTAANRGAWRLGTQAVQSPVARQWGAYCVLGAFLLAIAGCSSSIVLTPDAAMRSWRDGAALPLIERAASWWRPVGVQIVIADEGGLPIAGLTDEQWQAGGYVSGWIASSGSDGCHFRLSILDYLESHDELAEAFAHEMGHVFGMGHETTHPSAVMWPTPHAANGLTDWDVALFGAPGGRS